MMAVKKLVPTKIRQKAIEGLGVVEGRLEK
jgi:hypothetical protein